MAHPLKRLQRPTACRIAGALLACRLAAWSLPAAAEVYRYVDENGVIIYSQTPPAQGETTAIRPAPGPSAAEQAAAAERLRQQLEADFDRRHAREQQAQEADEEAARAEQRAAACRDARTNLRALQGLGDGWLSLPDGRTVNPTPEQQQRLLEQTQSQIRQLCD